MSRRMVIPLVLLLTAWARPAVAADYYPLDPGRYWEVHRPSTGDVIRREVSGTFPVGEALATVVDWVGRDREDYLWEEPGTGVVQLLGTRNHLPGWIRFDPPITLWIPGSQPGDAWGTLHHPVRVHPDGTETVLDLTNTIYAVQALESVSTPAGEYTGLRLRRYEVCCEKRPYTVDHEWLVDGIGLVRRYSVLDGTVIEELVGFGPTVETRDTSFGAVKSGF